MSGIRHDPENIPAAKCGRGTIDGAVWRPGDPVKHLGPPYAMVDRQSPAFYHSRLFSTRCGIGPRDEEGNSFGWRRQGDWGDGNTWYDDDDYWCPPCLAQAGIACELWPADDEES